MRVALVCPSFPPTPCGIGDVAWRLAVALSERGLDVSVVTSANSHAESFASDDSSFALYRVMKGWGVLQQGQLVQLLGKVRPDVVHVQYETGIYGARNWGAAALPLRLNAAGFKVVTTLHEVWGPLLPVLSRSGRVSRASGQLMVGLLGYGSHALIATNDVYLQRVRSILRQCGASTRLVRLGSPLPSKVSLAFDRQQLRRHYGVAPEDMLIAYFGFLRHDKGPDLLIEALARLGELTHLKLIMLGGGQDHRELAYRDELQQLALRLGIADRVIWQPYLPPQEVVDALATSDVVALPFRDGASLRRTSLLTALQLGLPIVTTGTEGNLEPVTGRDVVLVAPESGELASALHKIALCPQLRQQYSRKALDVSRHFSWETIVEATLQVYSQVRSH